MKKSVLKRLTKTVLKEIYQTPEEEGGLIGFLSHIAQKIHDTNPVLTNISKGHHFSHETLKLMQLTLKDMVKAILTDNQKAFEKGASEFNHKRSGLLALLMQWAQQFHDENPSIVTKMDKAMNEAKRHLEEMAGQFQNVINNLRIKNDTGGVNYINAQRELNHLNEIFIEMKKTIDEIFQIGIESGYGKKNK